MKRYDIGLEHELIEDANGRLCECKEMIKELESNRQVFANVIDLTIPRLPVADQRIALATFESYHRVLDRKIVELGGESVAREYKTPVKK